MAEGHLNSSVILIGISFKSLEIHRWINRYIYSNHHTDITRWYRAKTNTPQMG